MSEFFLFQSHLNEPVAIRDKASRSKGTLTHSLQPPPAAARSPQAQHSAVGLAARSSRAGTAHRSQARLCNAPLLPRCPTAGLQAVSKKPSGIPERAAQHRAAHSTGMSHFLCSSAPARLNTKRGRCLCASRNQETPQHCSASVSLPGGPAFPVVLVF